MSDILAVGVRTKAYVTLGLVLLALFQFWSAMYVFGRKGSKPGAKWVLRLHRIGGYAFVIYWLWPIWIGLGLLERHSQMGTGWSMNSRVFHHAMFGVVVLLLLLLKISFVRVWVNFRRHARMLGFIITILTITTWLIAGWFWLNMMGAHAPHK